MRIGLFGGTFDPVHLGHLILAQALLEEGPLDRVVFIPAGHPPHKAGPFASAADRLEMVRRAIARQPRFEVSDVEIRREGPSYTVDTVDALRSQHPGDELYLILGQDGAEGLPSWHDVDRLLDLCRVLVAARPGHDPAAIDRLPLAPRHVEMLRNALRQTPRIEISATDIRRRRAEGRTISYLVPWSVQHLIVERNLYAENLGSGR